MSTTVTAAALLLTIAVIDFTVTANPIQPLTHVTTILGIRRREKILKKALAILILTTAASFSTAQSKRYLTSFDGLRMTSQVTAASINSEVSCENSAAMLRISSPEITFVCTEKVELGYLLPIMAGLDTVKDGKMVDWFIGLYANMEICHRHIKSLLMKTDQPNRNVRIRVCAPSKVALSAGTISMSDLPYSSPMYPVER